MCFTAIFLLCSSAPNSVSSWPYREILSSNLIACVRMALEEQMKDLPRKELASAALENSRLILMTSKELTIQFANNYGPEHLSLIRKDEAYFLERITNAASVFVGSLSAESIGDYASGPNHTLPTGGNTRAYSGLTVGAFSKTISYQRINAKGLSKIGPIVEQMAEAEGLQGHKNAVSIRLKKQNNENDRTASTPQYSESEAL